MVSTRSLVLLSALALAIAAPAGAHHRQTPPILQFTTSGDTPLPRASAQGPNTFTLSVQSGSGHQIVTISPFRDPTLQVPVGQPGNNSDPAISFNGKRVALATSDDPLQLGLPGEQLVLNAKSVLIPLTQDPSGTSTNPVVDTAGLRIAFESAGDLAGTGHPGIPQVYVRQPDGTIQQASMGVGTSRNAVLSPQKSRLAFESTSDPMSGADTGISQIWLGDLFTATATPITNGLGPSSNPALSDDGGLLAFESIADLAGTLGNTGVPQIFSYDPKSKTFAQITNDAGGCTLPGVSKVQRDWRITFVCGGEAYFYMLRADQRYHVQTGGVTQRVLGEMGIHFLILSTTGDLLHGGTTPGKQVYMVNLFKHPADPVPGLAHWFPVRGISPLHGTPPPL
jgi:Tol biopolymer transport system component